MYFKALFFFFFFLKQARVDNNRDKFDIAVFYNWKIIIYK